MSRIERRRAKKQAKRRAKKQAKKQRERPLNKTEKGMLEAALEDPHLGGPIGPMCKAHQMEVWKSLEEAGLVTMKGDMVKLTPRGLEMGEMLKAAGETPKGVH
jgi:hypothetical protein